MDVNHAARHRFMLLALLVSLSLGRTSSIATEANQLNRPCRKQIWVVKYSNLFEGNTSDVRNLKISIINQSCRDVMQIFLLWLPRGTYSWWWCSSCKADMYPTIFDATVCSPRPKSKVPVIVPTKIATTSKRKEEHNKNRMLIFNRRVDLVSLFRGDVLSRLSHNVTKTAPAIRAAGAPIPLVLTLVIILRITQKAKT